MTPNKYEQQGRRNQAPLPLALMSLLRCEFNRSTQHWHPTKINRTTIDAYDDHRIAMCFSLAAFGDSPITINEPECTSKTFPNYSNLLEKVAC